ncbi:MAG TPA: hypothetical protein VEW42_02350 [Candidatus Eisenbacteria bacterium]|nr:hypothetical protein [Candidatus Eisenbacteria bacterium]
MRKFLVLLLFFTLAPSLLILSIFLLSSQHTFGVLGVNTRREESPFAYAALAPMNAVFEGSATLSDKRTYNLKEYLSLYHSPLLNYSSFIVSKADEYGIDYRLLPAIAMQETGLCKKVLAGANYNCWGYGVWGKKVTSFSSYEEAITTISRYFAKRKEKGIESLDEIGKIYNPGNTNHWKENVAFVMNQL